MTNSEMKNLGAWVLEKTDDAHWLYKCTVASNERLKEAYDLLATYIGKEYEFQYAHAFGHICIEIARRVKLGCWEK